MDLRHCLAFPLLPKHTKSNLHLWFVLQCINCYAKKGIGTPLPRPVQGFWMWSKINFQIYTKGRTLIPSLQSPGERSIFLVFIERKRCPQAVSHYRATVQHHFLPSSDEASMLPRIHHRKSLRGFDGKQHFHRAVGDMTQDRHVQECNPYHDHTVGWES